MCVLQWGIRMRLDIHKDFPILDQNIHGRPLVYLDSAASSQKPKAVIEAMTHYYEHDHANIHRGIYTLSERATVLHDQARDRVKQFINAKSSAEIIFVRGTTEAINLAAHSYGRSQLRAGDEIIVSVMEHHANIVPWQMLAASVGAHIKVIPLLPTGDLDMENYASLFSPRTRLVAITHASNVLGTVNPIKKITAIAHAHHVPVLVDGAQAVPHLSVDVQDLDCDFYVFSAHKMYGPTGIGVLYGKQALLENMPPWQGGGDMIAQVSFSGTTYAPLPAKFEAGTPAIAEAIGLHAAIDYIETIGMPAIMAHEAALMAYAKTRLGDIPGFRFIGMAKEKVGVIAFTLDDIHPHDMGTILDRSGIAIRAGHHCAMPLVMSLGLPAVARVSFGIYSRRADVDALVKGLYAVKKVLA